MGARRPRSPLGEIQPEAWPAEYTPALFDLLNVLGLLVDMESDPAEMLERICTGPFFKPGCDRCAWIALAA